ncbi:protein kinase domain containing protein [Stylonychia lemnae]|uniref:non-specific serine/threonine protein kinase n=1 Tax=Stylonychia lemnae TaxID=5949 RepID=A0A078A983_STYLE|nr:protein kinase domain containing protein [Stylonychia lemnae]|eukprot:CDW78132.1 protein kinase domain containing protein [Stylonychia lemnae]
MQFQVRLLQKIRHTNIVAYKDSFVDREQYLNMVMTYCDGGDMYTKIKNSKGKNFPEPQIIDWLVQMSLALLYLHERKILHRDMKTQNIFLKNGKIRLGDFGIAKVLDSTKDFANTVIFNWIIFQCIGTPYYMSPELFKNKPYSYKSDVWALGCVLYEMCNLRHAFDAQSINGLAVKILRGSYPPLNNTYSKQLRDLIQKMLSVKPSTRPTILDILNKSFVRKRAIAYINECVNGPPVELAPTDVDDMNYDSVKDQGEKLGFFGNTPESQSSLLAGRGPISGAMNAKKMRKVIGGSQIQQQKIPTPLDQKKELARLKKEILEKKRLEKKVAQLETEAQKKQKEFADKFGDPAKPKQGVGAPNQQKPPQSKQKAKESIIQKKGSVISQQQETLVNQNQKANKNQSFVKNEGQEEEKSQISMAMRKGDHTTSQSSISIDSKMSQQTSGPINSYQEFSKIFNPKSVGLHQKGVRRSSHENPSNQTTTVIEEKQQPININRGGSQVPPEKEIDYRAKVMMEKEKRRKDEEEKRLRELDKIRQETAQRRQEAFQKEQLQYRPSTALKMCLGEQNQVETASTASGTTIQMNLSASKQKNKKIEEDYSMFEEVKDDELEDIIEEEIEEESEDERADDLMLTSNEEREERRAQREELKTLKTQLMTMKQKLTMKTVRIEEIKETLKRTQLMTRVLKDGTVVPDPEIIDEVVKEYENQEEDEEEDPGQDEFNGEDDEDELGGLDEDEENEDDEDDGMDNGLEQVDPQILKIRERIKFLRHRCMASLGNQLFEKALNSLKSNYNKSADENREMLIKILGEESIGFWAIFDQIVFFEGMLDEISTNESGTD